MRFWLALHDLAAFFRLPYRAQIWLLMRAANAVHYDPLPEPDRSREPF